MADLTSLHNLILPTLANAIVVVSAYLAVASLIWGFADASMDQPVDLTAFDAVSADRVAHRASVGHSYGRRRYGFRMRPARGPRGNGRIVRIMDRIEAIHNVRPFDLFSSAAT